MTDLPKPWATRLLLAAIFGGFLLEIVTGAWLNEPKLGYLGGNLPIDYLQASGEYWRLLSSMFLHGDGTIRGDLLHLLSNSWALFQLGTLYEMMFGSRRFLVTYFTTGLIASLASSIHLRGMQTFSVGASGAIFGILGAFIFSLRRSPRWRNDPVTKQLMPQFLFWIVLNIAIGFSVKEIDNTAHIGGLISGLLMGLWPHRVPPPPPSEGIVDVTPASQ